MTIKEQNLKPPIALTRGSRRVVDILSERIASGTYGIGEQLPTERSLAGELRVHRRVVRVAIDYLVQQGLVMRRPHCRPTVGAPEEFQGSAPKSHAPLSASNLVALIMWHGGGPLEHAGTSQQRIFWGINQALVNTGRHAIFLDIGGVIGTETDNASREAAHLQYVLDNGFGGAIFYPYAYRSNRDLVKRVSESVPLVMLDRKIAGVDVDFVGIENHDAIFEMTGRLIAEGHRRIAYITCFEPIEPVQERVRGYVDAMRSAGTGDLVETVITLPPFHDERAWGVVDAVFGLPAGKRPTAAVCFTDYSAVHLAERLECLGLSVPEDVALTGFDDIVPALPNGLGLSTVAQPYEQIGSEAASLILRRIADPSLPTEHVALPARLVMRESSVSRYRNRAGATGPSDALVGERMKLVSSVVQ